MNKTLDTTSDILSENYISLLPNYISPSTLLIADRLPCHAAKIKSVAIKSILKKLKRETWVEGLYAREKDLTKIRRYKNTNGNYKNDFNENQFLAWIKAIEDNTAICEMENIKIGKGIFIPPQKKLSKGVFIPSSGIIKLDPTKEELETENHCSALQDLNSPKKTIYGFINPETKGGMLDLINHAPNLDELENFKFKNPAVKKMVATANLQSAIKFYNGYAIMGAEVIQDINGGEYGKQLLWSYAQPDEYLPHYPFILNNSILSLFDNRNEHNGETIDVNNYSLREINIFLDTGKTILLKVACLTRWELMEGDPESKLVFSIEDPYLSTQSKAIQSPIYYGYLQTYLKKNPAADRVIIKILA